MLAGVMHVIGIVEGIIYLTKSGRGFRQDLHSGPQGLVVDAVRTSLDLSPGEFWHWSWRISTLSMTTPDRARQLMAAATVRAGLTAVSIFPVLL